MSEPVLVDDLDAAIEEYKGRGFRLDMIFPADDPREAMMSEPPAVAGGLSIPVRLIRSAPDVQPPTYAGDWIRGRAGMDYRDLIPGRLDGKVIASHIRLVDGGPVPDYAHYHKVACQVIYCLKGRIRVVYEDQGEPFWLESGDLVLQPPEIRHRVLECTAGAEVIEITSPAEHETWVDHDLELPNERIDPERLFCGRRFFRHRHGQDDARDEVEGKIVAFANALSSTTEEKDRLHLITTFSQTLSQN